MKLTKKSVLLTLLMTSLCVSCATTEVPKEIPQTPKAQTLQACDELLDMCATLVEKQREAIKAQESVIIEQDKLIGAQEEQVQEEKTAKNTWRIIAILEGALLVILHLL